MTSLETRRPLPRIDILYEPRTLTYRMPLRPPEQSRLLQGTLDLLILKALALGDMHGLGLSRRIEQMTGGSFRVKPGSLFPALHRMEEAGWLIPRWGESEANRRAKYYRLSAAGRKQIEVETLEWNRIAFAMSMALEAT